MLCSMAIRLKEWGMLAYPRQGVHLPLNSVNDWGRTGYAVGQGISAAGQGLAELLPSIERVTRAGDQAGLVAELETIGQETADELQNVPVRDWSYSWQQAYTPRVQEMLAQLPLEEREQALRLSEEYGRRFALDGRRRMEVQRLRNARNCWQKQVDSAVQRGDTETALRWVEQGRGVFVPESEMQQERNGTRSRSLQNKWLQELRANPYATLAAWRTPGAALPEGESEVRQLETEMQQTRSHLFSGLASELGTAVEQGAEPDEQLLAQAAEAGVLDPGLVEQFHQPRRALQTSGVCDWLRRIDERADHEDEKITVEIALSPIPVEQKQRLLQRLQLSAAQPPQRRVEMSRTLWNLYRDGHFGCPGDEEALQSLGRLQEEALLRMASGKEKETETWLARLCESGDTWVCFEKN